MRNVLLIVLVAVPFGAASAADEAKGDKVDFGVYDAYFEKNDSGLKGDASYLIFMSKAAFDKVFALTPGKDEKKKTLSVDTFKAKTVVALVKRGDRTWTYKVEKVTVDGDTLYIQYEAEAGKEDKDGKFASPLILSVPKKEYAQIAFIENGKHVGGIKAASK